MKNYELFWFWHLPDNGFQRWLSRWIRSLANFALQCSEQCIDRSKQVSDDLLSSICMITWADLSWLFLRLKEVIIEPHSDQGRAQKWACKPRLLHGIYLLSLTMSARTSSAVTSWLGMMFSLNLRIFVMVEIASAVLKAMPLIDEDRVDGWPLVHVSTVLKVFGSRLLLTHQAARHTISLQ